jgi:hypothetical protein
MATWGMKMWAFFIILCEIMAGLLYLIYQSYVSIGVGKYYLTWGTFLVAALIW